MKRLVLLSYLAQLRLSREAPYVEDLEMGAFKTLDRILAGALFLVCCMLVLIIWHCGFWFTDWMDGPALGRVPAGKTPVLAVDYQAQRLAFRTVVGAG